MPVPSSLVPVAGLLLVVGGTVGLPTAHAVPPRGQDADLTFEEVVLGENHGCGRTQAGAVRCWGTNDRGQLGNGTYADSAFPLPVTGLSDVVTLAAGAHHTCALTRDRMLHCWGDNQAGQLGGGTQETHAEPVLVDALGPSLAVAGGTSHTCAVALAGTVSCWGDNLYRQLGVDDLRRSPRPVPVSVPPAVDIAAGYGHACAATRSGSVYCWGDASHYAVGRPAPSGSPLLPPLPIDVPLPDVRAVAARFQQTCALHAEGVHCWGAVPSDGGEGSPAALRIKQAGLVQLSVGWNHACALHPRGEVTCFGDNATGQLGATRTARDVVVGSYGVRDASWVAAGRGETCAARGDTGRAVCWGMFSPEEKAAAIKETQERPPEDPPVRYKAPRGTDLDLSMQEVLQNGKSQLRLEIRTLEDQTCSNTRIEADIQFHKKQLKVHLGKPYLPHGQCIAKAAPAIALVDLPADTKGRVDLTVRWKNQEDLYQIFVRKDRVDVIPMASTFSRWPEPKRIHLIPEGSLAVTCVDHLEFPLCQRRVRDGLPTCKDVMRQELVRDAPPLKKHDFANAFFTADPRAEYISPDFEHERYRRLFTETFQDGSQCLELLVRTWQGREWKNIPPETGAP